MTSQRRYDIILLGATGYTGKLCAEHMIKSASTSLRWAIAGRSSSKLQKIKDELVVQKAPGALPEIESVNLNDAEIENLVKQTKVLLNTIGPYHLYSTPIVQACAENGTHYLDVTGETPWVKEIIEKFEASAKTSGAILIPEIGMESAPSDILAYTATRLIRQVWDCGTMDMVASFHELKSSGVSGGTLATALGVMDHYPLKAMRDSMANPFVLSPIAKRDHRQTKYPEPSTYSRSFMQKLLGVWSYPFLGNLTTSLTAAPNVAIVHRSSGLNPNQFGHNFTYEEYMRVSNPAIGILIHFAIAATSLLLVVPPIRWLAKSLATTPGIGPSAESRKNDSLELRGVAVAEQLSREPRKALASFRYVGSVYELTAVTLVEGGLTLLENADEVRQKFGAGFLTPSCLGDRYVDRLEKSGVQISVKQIGDAGSK